MMTTTTIIQDKQPALILLDAFGQVANGYVAAGNVAIPLAQGTVLETEFFPSSTPIQSLRVRLATYCRSNHCHLSIEIGSMLLKMPAQSFVDNQYLYIHLPVPYQCEAGQPLRIRLYCEDATPEHMLAVWCSRRLPMVQTQLQLQPLHLPENIQPRISIVIPVFNKALYTYNCLLSLCATETQISTEVIVVDNASSDETAEMLAQLTGNFHIISNKDNQGFVNACRQGAAIARGEFVLFLNNDTQVMPDWLSSMLAVMDADPTVGITGSKLIYPDGRLQEAGGIIYSDASGCNYGRFQDPSLPHFNQDRLADYCSGASLMIRKSLWEQLGGFDQRYAPAYYEDTDLCFATRAAGYKVYYCHDSEVIHHEGITAGTDVTKGYKAYQEINKQKFIDKWREVLNREHLPPQTPSELAALRLMHV